MLTQADWRRRISAGGSFLAYLPQFDAAAPVGIIAGIEAGPGTIELISAWVRPPARPRSVTGSAGGGSSPSAWLCSPPVRRRVRSLPEPAR
jgi:hypothetical protein